MNRVAKPGGMGFGEYTSITRSTVSVPRWWTGEYSDAVEPPRCGSDLVRNVRLVQSFESRKDAEAAVVELSQYENWKGRICVIDIAEMRLMVSGSVEDHDKASAWYDDYAKRNMQPTEVSS